MICLSLSARGDLEDEVRAMLVAGDWKVAELPAHVLRVRQIPRLLPSETDNVA